MNVIARLRSNSLAPIWTSSYNGMASPFRESVAQREFEKKNIVFILGNPEQLYLKEL